MQGRRAAVRREIRRDPKLGPAAIDRHPSALVDAAKRGDITGVGLLAEIGYDVDARRIGQAALHVAAYAGNR